MVNTLFADSQVAPSFVAIGDSFTEGLNDPAPGGGFRGWADRLAGLLAAEYPGLRYANLAVRGKLLREIVAEQVPAAAAMSPGLVSLAGGGNDMLRPGADPDTLAELFDVAVARLRQSRRPGAHLHRLRPGRDTGAAPAARPDRRLQHAPARDRRRQGLLPGRPVVDAVPAGHERVEHGPPAPVAGVAPAGSAARCRGPGHPRHRRLARPADGADSGEAGAVETAVKTLAGAGTETGVLARPGVARAAWVAARREDARWAREYLLPWVNRRLRGTSSGDGLPAKRPSLQPVTPAL